MKTSFPDRIGSLIKLQDGEVFTSADIGQGSVVSRNGE